MPVRLVRRPGKVKFPQEIHANGVRDSSWSGKREAFPLADGFCVTDYYAQGQSFRDDTWLAHLGIPDGGRFVRATVLVTLTRFRDWDAVLPWGPLWSEGNLEERERVIDAFHRAAYMPQPLFLSFPCGKERKSDSVEYWSCQIDCTSL